MSFILDASVAMLWLTPGTNPANVAYAGTALNALKESHALAPSIWPLEIRSAIAKIEARNIVTEAESHRFIALLEQLDIMIDPVIAGHPLGDALNLARRYRLSVYDATYLELALRTGHPLATLDADLIKAATFAGISIFGRSAKIA